MLLGIYLGRSGTISSLGAAGALIALLIWIYYSAQIFLFGAAFTRVHAEGDKAMVDRSSQAVSAAAQEEQRQPVRRRELEASTAAKVLFALGGFDDCRGLRVVADAAVPAGKFLRLQSQFVDRVNHRRQIRI